MLSVRAAWRVIVLVWALSACTVQLVSPYNPELARMASSMQAEVTAWDLKMRSGAGTIADDPRNPEILETLNKWRGEAAAMLTLAISNDPGNVSCGEAVKAMSGAIKSRIAAILPEAAATAAAGSSAGARGVAAMRCLWLGSPPTSTISREF